MVIEEAIGFFSISYRILFVWAGKCLLPFIETSFFDTYLPPKDILPLFVPSRFYFYIILWYFRMTSSRSNSSKSIIRWLTSSYICYFYKTSSYESSFVNFVMFAKRAVFDIYSSSFSSSSGAKMS